MTTKTEQIVRLLKSALAGTASIHVNGDFSQMWHQNVDVTIEGIKITFWMRNEIRRVEEVTFPDGTVMTTEGFEAERWTPPIAEFPAWHSMMRVTENTSDEELGAVDAALLKSLSLERLHAFEPWHYLSDDQQTEFENLLKRVQK